MKIVPPDDPVLNDCYKELMDYLSWPVVFEDEYGIYRFKGKKLALAIKRFTQGKIFNHLALEYHEKKITLDEWMQFYIDTETSLSGFLDIFHDKIWPEDEQDDDEISAIVIE